MSANVQKGIVWARDVARAMETKLNTVDCSFYWAKAGEDILRKEPTCVWPEHPNFTYTVQEGSNEGLHVEVFQAPEKGEPVSLLVVKFLSTISAAAECLSLVSEFVENFDPEPLRTA